MTKNNAFFVAVYWGPRAETAAASSFAISSFLREWSERYPRTWLKKGRSKKQAQKSVIDVENLVPYLVPNRDELTRAPIEKLGYSFEAWDGRCTSVSILLGGFAPKMWNFAIVELDYDCTIDELRTILDSARRYFRPSKFVACPTALIAENPDKDVWDLPSLVL